MNKRMLKRFVYIMVAFVLLTSGTVVNGYLTEDGNTAEMIRLERIVSSTSSLVGKVETITYNLTGDTIAYDPPKEIALVVDVSGSMAWDVNGRQTNDTEKKRITLLKNAAASFVRKWENRNCKICVVPFSYYVKEAPELVSMSDSDCISRLDDDITALTPNGGTNVGDGIRVAYHTLNNSGNTDASKYIITLTDGQPNVYTKTSESNSDYYRGSDIITSTRRTSTNESKGMAYCTSIIGNMILNNDKFKSFVIGFATPTSLVNNLNSIGISSGADELENGNHFYYAGSQTELNQVYADISDIIANDIPFTSALFSELLPEGTTIEPAAVSALESQGYNIIDNYPDPDDPANKVRTKITKSLSGSIFLARKYPDATTAPQNRIYQLKPYSFSITVIYTTPGIKTYKDIDASVIYEDPFKNGSDIEYCNTSETVEVIQPVTGLTNTHAVIMPEQNENEETISAKVLPDTEPNIAYNRMIADWTVISEENVTGTPVSPGSVISISCPDEPEPLNGVRKVAGLAAGKAYVEAKSAGENLNGVSMRGTSVIYVVDGEVINTHMNNGDIVDLNDLSVKYIPNTNTNEVKAEYMTFHNWRLKNTADAVFINLEASGVAKALRPLENDVPVQVDIDYTVGSPGSAGYIHLTKTIEMSIIVAQPVTGVTVTEATIMSGSKANVTAEVMPIDVLNRKISRWRLIDESGNDITGSSDIADISEMPGSNNCIIEAEGKHYGKVIVMAESEANNLYGMHETGSSVIYVVDVECDNALSLTLWSSGKIEPVSHIPTELSGLIKYTFISDNPSYVSVGSSGEVRALQTTAGAPVMVRIRAEYFDAGGNPTGQVKELTCMVSVVKPNIDIN